MANYQTASTERIAGNNADLWTILLAAAENLTPDHLRQLGITVDHALAAGGLGFDRISPFSGGLFETGGEVLAMLVPVFSGRFQSQGAPLPDCELEDILAFDPHRPESSWLYRGGACLLGASALSNQLLGHPLHIYRTPLSWLRAGCDGVVILDDDRAYINLVTAQYGVAGEDPAHTEELRQLFTNIALQRLPRFLVRKEMAA